MIIKNCPESLRTLMHSFNNPSQISKFCPEIRASKVPLSIATSNYPVAYVILVASMTYQVM